MTSAPGPHEHTLDCAEGLLAVDARNRTLALQTRTSFVVEAPAGAGKTELLTQRFLALLNSVDDPEEIVALTFTNKAAAEMRHRIVSSLQRAAQGQVPPEAHKKITYALALRALQRDAAQDWGLLMNSGRLQITTLDAWCAKLAHQMPLLSRMGGQAEISTDAEPLYAQAALETLEGVEAEGPQAEAIARVLSYLDNDASKLQTLLVDMLASRDQWLRHARSGLELASAEQALQELVAQELQRVAQAMPLGWEQTLQPWARYAASQVCQARARGEAVAPELESLAGLASWTQTLAPEAEFLPQWRGLAQLLLNKSGGLRSQLPTLFGFGAPEGKAYHKPFKQFLEGLRLIPALADAWERVRTLPSPAYGEQELQLLQDLLTALRVAEAHLWLGFKQRGLVDFTEIAQRALLALGQEDAPTELALRLDYRLTHLLVDEFQDTSPTQVELLKRLTAGWTESSGHTLFVVGDPMQSIYKFRKAEVGLFLRVRDQGLGHLRLQTLTLTRNNRSNANLVEWVNRVFPAVFSPESNFHRGAVKFAKAQATQAADADARVTWHPVLDELAAADEEDNPAHMVAEREAQAVVDIVLATQHTQPKATVAVLVRARTHLEALVQLLRTRHPQLKYQAIEIEGLARRQVVQDMLSLTHALLHLGDRLHWLAVLRAPWCGLRLQDLHTLAAHDHRTPVWGLMYDDSRISRLSEDGRERLLHLRRVFELAFAHRGSQRLRRWVYGVWLALGGPHCLTGAADLADVHAFLDVLDPLDWAGNLNLDRLALEVDKLYAAPDPQASDSLQIMTIHKSKGLEFDTVILPGLHKKASRTDKRLLLWDEVIGADGLPRLVVAPIAQGRRSARDEPNKFDFLHQFENERSQNEAQRLLYVAVTRAKKNLHLVACAKPDREADEGVKAAAAGSFLALLWHDAAQHCIQAAQEAGAPATKALSPAGKVEPERSYNHHLVRLERIPERPLPEPTRAAAPSSPAVPSLAHQGPADAQRFRADVGVLVHRYLQLIAQDGPDLWGVERIPSLRRPMQHWLARKGYSAQDASAGANETCAHLVASLGSAQGRWVLERHDEAASEAAYATLSHGQWQTQVIDRTFKHEGVRWIVDFKTSSDVPASAEAVRQEYVHQLQRYAQLFQDETVRLMVFYTKNGSGIVL